MEMVRLLNLRQTRGAQGCIMLNGPRTVPVRSGHDGSRVLQFF
jgi:hypothetical protein